MSGWNKPKLSRYVAEDFGLYRVFIGIAIGVALALAVTWGVRSLSAGTDDPIHEWDDVPTDGYTVTVECGDRVYVVCAGELDVDGKSTGLVEKCEAMCLGGKQ